MPFDDTDLTGYNLIAMDEAGAQFPPTPPEYGWLLKILEAKKNAPPDGSATIDLTAEIEAKSEWNGHRASIRLFLTSQYPDSNPIKKVCSFAYAAGIKGAIGNTELFVNRQIIVYFEVAKDPQYTRAKKWWPYDVENSGRIAIQPLPTWSGEPNGKEHLAKTAARNSNKTKV